jgi:hypothetical protein
MTDLFELTKQLLLIHPDLATLNEASKWCETANGLMEQLDANSTSTAILLAHTTKTALELRAEAKQKSFFGRFFKSKDEKVNHQEQKNHRDNEGYSY